MGLFKKKSVLEPKWDSIEWRLARIENKPVYAVGQKIRFGCTRQNRIFTGVIVKVEETRPYKTFEYPGRDIYLFTDPWYWAWDGKQLYELSEREILPKVTNQ